MELWQFLITLNVFLVLLLVLQVLRNRKRQRFALDEHETELGI